MNFNDFFNQKFTLLDDYENRFFLVSFILIYSVLFINLFVPFNMNNWVNDSAMPKYLQLSAYGFIGALCVFVSQFLIRRWFKKEQLLLSHFLFFTGLELFSITMFLTIIYVDIIDFKQFLEEFLITLKYTFLIALIPYSLVLLILSLLQSKSKLKELKKVDKKVVLSSEMINFKDEKGNIKLTFPLKDIIYLESTDNYVYLHYNTTGGLKKEILRNSLKKLENDFKDLPLKRCHRSYMVNLENLNLIKRSGQKVNIKLNHCLELIPVSRSYYQEFKNYIPSIN